MLTKHKKNVNKDLLYKVLVFSATRQMHTDLKFNMVTRDNNAITF